MVTGVEVLCLLLVSLLWGCTNPLMKSGSAGIESVNAPGRVSQFVAELKFLILNKKYLLPVLLNQAGSLLYFYTLSSADLSVAVPVSNSLTFVFTLLTGKLLGEDLGGKGAVAGMVLTMMGVTLCVISASQDS
ncbi:transmembrane protein 234 isoform X1 [Synchiropus splendidus]|uniref:transmembrane protein 234 isoform X1 n=2 Tax=Synchiropus splendidus TaxID=270530 RepID=UPI00237DDAAD|nr:transmembrane protein 234 isoform X1 [Synchiropus splendidus]XP_053701302.1 transmembrane protein 234 isoform X1 [Synchiropus splendidus]